MSYQFLTSEQDGTVERLTLNRPEVRNAFNEELIAELTQWGLRTAEAASRGEVRTAVVSGAGKSFCAGADIGWMAKTVSYTADENLRDAAAAARMFSVLDRLPIPLIGRLHGAAIGGGAGLAAVCDIVVCDAETVFGFTEVKIGVIPAVIAPFVIAKIGRSAARELFLTGAKFSAARALALGLVHAVVPTAELDATVQRFVADMLSGAPQAIAAAKALIADLAARSLDDVSSITARAIAERRVSAEGQEGLRAFLNKQTPSWAK
jgi:methylglutaconyl-CoA hydratase